MFFDILCKFYERVCKTCCILESSRKLTEESLSISSPLICISSNLSLNVEFGFLTLI